jgi:3-methyladenine DNA glycosylase AlkD
MLNYIANELWETGYHEAKILAVLIMNKETIAAEDVERFMTDVMSWDLCDHLCKSLIIKLEDYKQFIYKWCNDNGVYYKRAAYTLIAAAVIHKKDLPMEEIDEFLYMIKENSNDNRVHVKKAISWALREIGKRDFECQEKAVLLAQELKESSDKNMIWVGKDAVKELETLVSVNGRGRLLTSKSKMGRQQ